MKQHIKLTVLITALVFAAPAAWAQSNPQSTCGPRDLVISKLEGSYGESRMGAGLRGTASILEIWASADSGTWTVLVTNTDGISCVVASGDNWHNASVTAVGAPV